MLIYSLRRFILFTITLLMLSGISYQITLMNSDVLYHHYDALSGWMHYAKHILTGDWGETNSGSPVLEQILYVLPATLELCFMALLIALFIGIPLGTIAGIRRGHLTDNIISSLTLITSSTPIFWLAILMIMFFSLHLGSLPVSGRNNLLVDIPQITGFTLVDIFFSDHPDKGTILENTLSHFLMPTLVLAISPTTEIIRLLRDSVSEVMTQNYIKIALIKGLSKTKIITHHVLKNALPPIIPKFGIQISAMMTMAIITESIFNWPGIGTWLLDALNQQDYNAIQGGVLTIGSLVLIANILSDLIGSSVSPLTRKEWYALR